MPVRMTCLPGADRIAVMRESAPQIEIRAAGGALVQGADLGGSFRRTTTPDLPEFL